MNRSKLRYKKQSLGYHYGDVTVWWTGTVVKQTEPFNTHRVQVKIRGLTENTPREKYPLAQLIIPTTAMGASGVGTTPNFNNGTEVFGFFLDGSDMQCPVILGSIPNFEAPNQFKNFSNVDNNINKEESSSSLNKVLPIPRKAQAFVPHMPPIRSTGTNLEKAYFYLRKPELLGNEYSRAAICGILGNLVAESGVGAGIVTGLTSGGAAISDINPKANLKFQDPRFTDYDFLRDFRPQGSILKLPERSFGIAQWYSQSSRDGKRVVPSIRLRNLYLFAAAAERPISDLALQLMFIKIELKNSPKIFVKGGPHASSRSGTCHARLKSKTITVDKASDAFCLLYEKARTKDENNKDNGQLEKRRKFSRAIFNNLTLFPGS
tara:strand:- start:960 stop:2093 length:1134 start_codon:yes stop_codon:yes gene_type:complete